MDKDGMGELAREITADLRAAGFDATYDDSGNIGRRYRRQDEVGTPFCVTVDYDSLEDREARRGSERPSGDEPRGYTVTLRERDSTEQVRVAVDDLPEILDDLRAGETTFSELDAPAPEQ